MDSSRSRWGFWGEKEKVKISQRRRNNRHLGFRVSTRENGGRKTKLKDFLNVRGAPLRWWEWGDDEH